MYDLCLTARPAFNAPWFSILDTASRLTLAFALYYRSLFAEPRALLRFAHGWNTLW